MRPMRGTKGRYGCDVVWYGFLDTVPPAMLCLCSVPAAVQPVAPSFGSAHKY